MIEKQLLVDSLLRINSQRQQSCRLKMMEPFERIEIEANNYQRSKRQVENQLLAFYNLKCNMIKKKEQTAHSPVLASKRFTSNKQSNKSKIRSLPFDYSLNNEEHFLTCSNEKKDSKQCFSYNNPSILIHDQIQHRNFNEYFNLGSHKKSMTNQQINKREQQQADGYEVINNFMKNSVQHREVSSDGQKQQNLYAITKDNKSFNNQSTMALSKFLKSSPSPQRKMRKTQNPGKMISNQKSKSKSKSKAPLIIKNIRRNQRGKSNQTELFESKSINKDNRKDFAGHIHHKEQQSMKQSHKMVNVECSKSIGHFSIQSSIVPSGMKNQQTPQKRMIDSVKSFVQLQDREPKNVQSDQRVLKANQPNKEQKIKRVSIILKNQKLKRKPKDTPNNDMNSQFGSLQNDDFSKNQKRSVDYDEQFTIFDRIKQGKLQTEKGQKPKINLIQLKKTFGVKNEEQLKRQIERQNKRFECEKIHLKQKIKDKEELFTSCQQVNFRRAASNQIAIATQEKQKIEKYKQRADEQEVRQQEENGFPIFNYLLEKIEKLKGTQKQSRQQKQKLPEYSPRIIKSVQSKKEDKKQRNGVYDSAENVLKPEIQEHLSSSCSFVDKKEKVTSKQIDKMNNLVSETVKRVTVNLSRAVGQKKRDNNVLPPSDNVIAPQQQQNNQNAIKKVQKSVVSEQKFIKIFGNQHSNKPEEYDISNDFFKLKQDDSKQNQDNFSHPSTVQKISQQSDSKSDVLQHLQQLRGDNFVNKLFPQRQELKEQPSKIQTPAQPLDFFVKKVIPEQSLIPKQETNKKPRQIIINVDELRDASMSNDAISFSKLLVSESKSFSLPEMVSFDLGTDSKYQPKKEPQSRPKTIETGFAKNGKVKRIQIQLQESSSSSQSQDQAKELTKKESSKSDHSQLDIDELDNYDSDQDQSQEDYKRGKGVVKPKAVLTPVIEEDLQESVFNKQPNIQSIRLNSMHQKKAEQTRKVEDEMKQLQLQFLKDFGNEKKESEVSEYKMPVQVCNKTVRKSNLRNSTSIKNDLSDNKFDDFSYSREEEGKGASLAAEKLFIEDIRSEIDNLKNRIEGSFISDSSKIFNKSALSSQSKPIVSEKKMAIENKKGASKIDSNQSHSNSTGKIFKSESIIKERLLENDVTEKESEKEEIDFDVLNEEDKKNQIYSGFKQDIDKLKRKMTFDAKIGLF